MQLVSDVTSLSPFTPDKSLRSEFPSADGHLYKVSLVRGQQGLGMSIFSNKSGRGVMVTSVVSNGVADETGKIKEGDEIVKVIPILLVPLRSWL